LKQQTSHIGVVFKIDVLAEAKPRKTMIWKRVLSSGLKALEGPSANHR
jgi:hypothetical protein